MSKKVKRPKRENEVGIHGTDFGFRAFNKHTGKELAVVSCVATSRKTDPQAFIAIRVGNEGKCVEIVATAKTIKVKTIRGKP